MTTALEKLANVIDALPLSTTCTLTINEPFTPPTEFEWDGDMMPTLKALVADWRAMKLAREGWDASMPMYISKF